MPPKNIRHRRVTNFSHIDTKADRKNPESIRRMFFDFIKNKFQSSCLAAANALPARPQSAEKKRGYQGKVSADSLYKMTRDIQGVSYGQLDALARFYKIPISVLLLYTRLCSQLDSGTDDNNQGVTEALDIISAFKHAILHMEEKILNFDGSSNDIYDHFNFEFFEEYVEVFAKHRDGEQPSLI